jgi:hypothetical protein
MLRGAVKLVFSGQDLNIRNSTSSIRNSTSFIRNSTSSIRNSTSSIRNSTSSRSLYPLLSHSLWLYYGTTTLKSHFWLRQCVNQDCRPLSSKSFSMNIISKCKDLNSSWEAVGCSATQIPLSVTWNPKDYYRVLRSLLPVLILSQINPVQTTPSHL